VNFIGHATVALWFCEDPTWRARGPASFSEFVLGAMLPDLAAMARLKLPARIPAGPLAEGVALHHRTDGAFHGDPSFVGLTHQTLDLLTSHGVARGPARGVAHVGVELLLDGELLRIPAVVEVYQAALAVLEAARSLFEPPERERWFAGRQRLSLDPRSEQIVRSLLPDVQSHVVGITPGLLSGLRRHLGNEAGPSNGAVLVR
jgi:hypothetical protein